MRDCIASVARVLLHVTAIFGGVLLGMLIVYSVGGAIPKVDLAIRLLQLMTLWPQLQESGLLKDLLGGQ